MNYARGSHREKLVKCRAAFVATERGLLSFVGADRTTHRENRFEHETENDSTIARPSMLHRLSRRQCGCEDRGKQRAGQMGESVK